MSMGSGSFSKDAWGGENPSFPPEWIGVGLWSLQLCVVSGAPLCPLVGSSEKLSVFLEENIPLGIELGGDDASEIGEGCVSGEDVSVFLNEQGGGSWDEH